MDKKSYFDKFVEEQIKSSPTFEVNLAEARAEIQEMISEKSEKKSKYRRGFYADIDSIFPAAEEMAHSLDPKIQDDVINNIKSVKKELFTILRKK